MHAASCRLFRQIVLIVLLSCYTNDCLGVLADNGMVTQTHIALMCAVPAIAVKLVSAVLCAGMMLVGDIINGEPPPLCMYSLSCKL